MDKKITPVVQTDHVKTRKRSEASKFAKLFLSDDAGKTKDVVMEDVLVPKARDLITSVLKAIIDTIFYGRGGYSGGSSKSVTSNVSYRAYYDNPSSSSSQRASSLPSFDDIIFEDAKDAAEVIKRMNELTQSYGVATYGALCELANVKVPYTAENFGWTDFSSAKVLRIPGGYTIKMPQMMPID